VAPERAALLSEVEALRRSLENLNKVMGRQVEDKVAEVAVPREELQQRLRVSGRRVAVGMVLLLVLLGGGIVLNRVTLNAARRDLSEQVTTCFLRPGAVSPAEAAACARRFGPDYAALQRRSAEATKQFTSLLKWAKSKGWQPPPG
jgi:hypothetical protein